MLSINKLREIEVALVRTLQGGHIVANDSSTLIWEPYTHGSIGLWEGSRWELVTPSGEYTSLTVTSGIDINSDPLATDTIYDVYAGYVDSENIDLILAPWTSDTMREHAPERFEGILVYDNDTELGKTKRYLGSIRLDSSGNLVDSSTQRFIANWDHPVPKSLETYNSSSSDWSRDAWGYVEYKYGNDQIRGELINIFPGNSIWGSCGCWHSRSQDNIQAAMALGLNGEDIGAGGRTYIYSYSGREVEGLLRATGYSDLRVGYSYITMMYKSYGGNINMYNGQYGGGCAIFYG